VFKIPEKTCSVCYRIFSLSKNPSGLVFLDKHFVCEDCCDNRSKEISKFTNTVMQSPNNGMPIALWLLHEQNKNKTIMTVTK
jgi:hypothetical protein